MIQHIQHELCKSRSFEDEATEPEAVASCLSFLTCSSQLQSLRSRLRLDERSHVKSPLSFLRLLLDPEPSAQSATVSYRGLFSLVTDGNGPFGAMQPPQSCRLCLASALQSSAKGARPKLPGPGVSDEDGDA